MAAIKAIVFDLDGTLIDSIPAVAAAVNRLLEEQGRRPLGVKETKTMVGWGAGITIEKAFEATGAPLAPIDLPEALERYLDFYLADPAGHTVVYPGVRQVLDKLVGKGTPMGICTNKPVKTTHPVLEALGLDRYFSAVACDDVPHRKPDGRHLRLTLERMGAAGRLAAMVGDNETDMAAARDAGLFRIGVTWGYPHDPIKPLDADVVIDAFADLPGALS
ncbi:MAG TPA: HAD-IA family hydrolase [Rhodospirillales bacterium]|jgi:phosphoglycolate phosphatase|nr:HAD-IA family hydrolase [Rhodospirillales bacterium]